MSVTKVTEPEKIPSSDSAGVLAFPIEGPMKDERYRLIVGMTDEDRRLRRQWLQDQILAESEPAPIPGYYEARFNPIRRAIMWPLNQVFKPLYPILGTERATNYRWLTGRGLLALAGVFYTAYYFKFNTHSWESVCGWKVYQSKPFLLPGHPDFGNRPKKDKTDFADFGFKDSTLAKTA